MAVQILLHRLQCWALTRDKKQNRSSTYNFFDSSVEILTTWILSTVQIEWKNWKKFILIQKPKN